MIQFEKVCGAVLKMCVGMWERVCVRTYKSTETYRPTVIKVLKLKYIADKVKVIAMGLLPFASLC